MSIGAAALTVDDVLNENEQQSLSELSGDISFTLEDILNERFSNTDQQDNAEGLFSEQQSNEDNPATQSQSSRDVDKLSIKKVEPKEAIVQCRKYTRIKDTQVPDNILAMNMTYNTLSNVSKLFDTNDHKVIGIGVPCCLSATSKRFLVIGTSLSNIVLFEVGLKQHKVLQPEYHANYGQVVSIDISKDNKYMVCGFSNGAITLWDLSYFTLTKAISSPTGQTITRILFWSNSYEGFISSDADGNVFLHTIEKYIWVSVRNKRLISRTAGVIYHDIRSNAFQSGRHFVALASTDFVLVLSLEPQVEIVTKLTRPYEFSNSKIPNIEFGRMRLPISNSSIIDVILVSWGCSVQLHAYDNSNRSDQFSLHSTYKHSESVYNMQMLSENMLLILDSNNRLQLVNLIDQQVKHTYEMPWEVLAQRYHRDKLGKPIKNSSNTICQVNTDKAKEVFIIGKDGIMRGRFFRWNEFIQQLILKKLWKEALKVLVDIFYGRVDIFADKVIINPATVILFHDMLLAYARTRLSQTMNDQHPSKEQQTQQINETLQTCIEFCIEIGSYEYLFNRLYSTLSNEFGVSQQFICSLEPFIQQSLIKQIPNRRLYEAIIEYYAASKIQLVDRLVTSLDQESIDYALTVEICLRLKLYSSMVYVSQLNEDFITPANRLLSVLQQSNTRQNECLSLLYSMVVLLSHGNSIVGTPLPTNVYKIGIRILLQWYLVQQNGIALIDINAEKYFQTLSKFMTTDEAGEVINQMKDEVDLFSLINRLKQILEQHGRNKDIEELSACLIYINSRWTIDMQTRIFCLSHLKQHIDMDALADFMDRNYEFIKQQSQWNEILKVLPTETKALIAIQDGNMQLALQLLQPLELDDQARRRLFARIGRYTFSNNVQRLAQIDCHRATAYLLEEYSPQEISREVEKVKQPFLRYSLIRRLMRMDSHNRVEWSKGLLLFYLESLCIYRTQKRVLYQLKKNIFPIQQALKIVTQYKLLLCQAYMSQPAIAFELYRQVYRQSFLRHYRKLEAYEYSSCRDMKYIFYAMLQLLKNSSLQALSDDWFILLQTVISPLQNSTNGDKSKLTIADNIQKIFKKKGSQTNPFFWTLFQIIERTLLQVSMHTTIDALTKQIQRYVSILNINFMLNSFKSTLTTYHRESQIYNISNRLILNDMVGHFKQIMTEDTLGITTQPLCHSCEKEMFGLSSYVFRCGHTYHLKCIDEQGQQRLKCPACSLQKVQFYEGSPDKFATKNSREQRHTTRFSNNMEEQQQKIVYSLMSFDAMVSSEQAEMENFTAIYDSFMLLY